MHARKHLICQEETFNVFLQAISLNYHMAYIVTNLRIFMTEGALFKLFNYILYSSLFPITNYDALHIQLTNMTER